MSLIQTRTANLRELTLASLLVAGNLLGVGILALPIKIGVSGFIPSLFDIIVIASLMLISAFVIAYRILGQEEHFDIPSFFERELGIVGRLLAIVCNLILLYGILVVYLSVISSIIHSLVSTQIPQSLIIFLYFVLASGLLASKTKFLQKSNAFLLLLLFSMFLILVFSGSTQFNSQLLSYMNWRFLPIGLPVAVSTFHFHNIIPTVKKAVHHEAKSLYRAITIGVLIGFVINVTWITVVLGSLPQQAANHCSLCYAFLHSEPATVPMTQLLHSDIFSTAGLIFALLAVTASYLANGLGLMGFIDDLISHHLKINSKMMVVAASFIPPLIIALINPNVFLVALDIVGGIGETILFLLLPGIILARVVHKSKKHHWLLVIAYLMIAVATFVVIYILLEKLGLFYLGPK